MCNGYGPLQIIISEKQVKENIQFVLRKNVVQTE